MSKNTPKIIRYGLIVLVMLLIGGYAFFNSRLFIKGPQVLINYPIDGGVLTEKKINLTGLTANTSFISVNDRAINIDEQGYFDVPVLLQDGYNQVVVKAHDKFNRQVTKTLRVVYNSNTESVQ